MVRAQPIWPTDRVAQAVPLLPAGLVVAIVTGWVATGGGYESQPALGGGYEPDPWYLGALALIGLACATAVGVGRVRLSRWGTLACIALGAYVAWSFLSTLWAHDKGSAFLGSDRALVYWATFFTFAILPWRSWSARGALALFAGCVGGIAVVAAVKVAHTADPSSLYLSERLAYPLGYYNASAALFMVGATTAVALSAQRGGLAILRSGGLVVAGVCLQLALLSQSRGWLFTAPIVLVLALVLIPGRLRLLAFAVPPIAATAAIAPTLLNVYAKTNPKGVPLEQPRLSHVLHEQGAHAVHAMVLADVALAVLAVLCVLVDLHVELTTKTRQRIDRSVRALTLTAILAGIVVSLIAVHGKPIGRVESAWHSFSTIGNTGGTSSSRFGALASNRADIWRVALHEFDQHPLAGIGQDNFATSYTRLRHTDEEPRWAHSIELRLLLHTGLVGALLFATFLAAVPLALLRGREGRAARTTAGILLLPMVVWLVHGSIDWFWEYPALSVPALAFAGATTALGQRPVPMRGAVGVPAQTIAWIGAVALLGVGALVAIAIPFLATRHVQRAIAEWPSRPALAYGELRSASSLLPFDAQVYLLGGAIALNSGEDDEARAWLTKAEHHEDEAWLTPFLLGLIDGEQGQLPASRAQLLRALRLNPRQQAVTEALRKVGGPRPLTFTEAQVLLMPHIATPPA